LQIIGTFVSGNCINRSHHETGKHLKPSARSLYSLDRQPDQQLCHANPAGLAHCPERRFA
jgi:hypothetical protein